MNLPDKIFAGDKLEFTETNSLYPASSGWAAKYVIINNTDKISITSAADGDDHTFTIESATTTTWSEGEYTAQLYYENGTTKEVIGRKQIKIEPDLVNSTTYDSRSLAKQTLDDINETITRLSKNETSSKQISVAGGHGRAAQFKSLEELIKAKNYYEQIVKQENIEEQIRQGKNPGGKVLLQFN